MTRDLAVGCMLAALAFLAAANFGLDALMLLPGGQAVGLQVIYPVRGE